MRSLNMYSLDMMVPPYRAWCSWYGFSSAGTWTTWALTGSALLHSTTRASAAVRLASTGSDVNITSGMCVPVSTRDCSSASTPGMYDAVVTKVTNAESMWRCGIVCASSTVTKKRPRGSSCAPSSPPQILVLPNVCDCPSARVASAVNVSGRIDKVVLSCMHLSYHFEPVEV